MFAHLRRLIIRELIGYCLTKPHCDCMDAVNESLSYAEVDYEYGAAVFLNVESVTEQNILGFIDTDDWLNTLTPRS